jgi:hypothetical protein
VLLRRLELDAFPDPGSELEATLVRRACMALRTARPAFERRLREKRPRLRLPGHEITRHTLTYKASRPSEPAAYLEFSGKFPQRGNSRTRTQAGRSRRGFAPLVRHGKI